MNNHFYKSAARFIWLLLLVLLWSNAAADIDEDFGVWGAIQGQGSFIDADSEMGRWQWWMEGQGRFFNDASKLGRA